MSVVSTMNSKRVTDEIRHSHDELEYFYMEAKRNKRLAGWAARKLGVSRKEYFLDLISEDLSQAGPKPVVDRILKDFKKHDIDIDEERIWEKLRKFERETLQDMLDEQAKRTKQEVKKKMKKKSKKK